MNSLMQLTREKLQGNTPPRHYLSPRTAYNKIIGAIAPRRKYDKEVFRNMRYGNTGGGGS